MKMNIAVTTRLSFKLMDENDWQQLYELDQDPAVVRFRTTPSSPVAQKTHPIAHPT